MKNLKTQILPLLRTERFVEDIEKIHGANIYVVGGAVRDFVIGKACKDIDLIVTGVPVEKLHTILSKYGKMDLVGESFAVTKFKLANWEEDFDISIPRREKKIGNGHKGFEVEFSHDIPLKEDLFRRDFTMNSMAMDLNGTIIDPFNGLDSIQNKTIEIVNKKAFDEDALRMVRAIQFAARFEFILSNELFASIFNSRKSIKEISNERILEEFEKIINKNGNMSIAFKLLEFSGLMKEIVGVHYRQEVLPLETKLDFYFNLLKHKRNRISKFFKLHLKGDSETAKSLGIINEIYEDFNNINKMDNINPVNEIRKMLFVKLKSTHGIFDCNVLPVHVHTELEQFKNGSLPVSTKQIMCTGDDIMKIKNIEAGPQVGLFMGDIVNAILSGSLNNNFEAIKGFLMDTK